MPTHPGDCKISECHIWGFSHTAYIHTLDFIGFYGIVRQPPKYPFRGRKPQYPGAISKGIELKLVQRLRIGGPNVRAKWNKLMPPGILGNVSNSCDPSRMGTLDLSVVTSKVNDEPVHQPSQHMDWRADYFEEQFNWVSLPMLSHSSPSEPAP